MRIGIDISPVVFGTGVAKYTSNLVKALAKHFPDEKFVLYGGSARLYGDLNRFVESLGKQPFEKALYPLPPKFLSVLFNRAHISIERFTKDLDVFHSWDWYTPGTLKAKLITTIHDLTSIKYPQDTNPEIVRQHRKSLFWIKREAKGIIAVSKTTKKDIVDILKINKNRVNIVYEALPEEQHVKVVKSKIDKVKKKYSIKKPYFISVASQEPRKNLNRIVEAYSKLEGKYNLVMVGKGGHETVAGHKGVIQTGYVDSDDLAALYSGSLGLVYASLYEGFGLPILEAFYHGVPVVTSMISSMPEVAGDAAVLVDPLRVDSIYAGMKEALRKRDLLVRRGKKRLKAFTWKKVAHETMAVYKKVMSEKT